MQMKLLDYMKLKGRFSFDDLIIFYGKDFDPQELLDFIDEGSVSVHTDGLGNAWHRFPYFTTKVEAQRDIQKDRADTKTDLVLEYIRKHPMSNGQEIKKGLAMSQEVFDRRKEKLLDDGKIVQEREGRAWVYRVAGKSPLLVPRGDPFKHVMKPAGPPTDGRFKRDRAERELSKMDRVILGAIADCPEDDRDVEHMIEDTQSERKEFLRSLAKLYRDGYVGKVVEGESTLYCSVDRV